MKVFKYRLEALRKLKKHREREKQKHLAAAVAQVKIQKDALTSIDTSRQKQLEDQRQRLAGRLSVADMLIYSRFLLKLKRDQLTGEGLLAGLEKETEKRRKELVQAAKERQIHDKLKERQMDRFNAEVRRLMAKDIDEVAIASFRRREDI